MRRTYETRIMRRVGEWENRTPRAVSLEPKIGAASENVKDRWYHTYRTPLMSGGIASLAPGLTHKNVHL